jgi:hypothetical protein
MSSGTEEPRNWGIRTIDCSSVASWKSGYEEKTLCVLLVQWYLECVISENVIVPVLKSVIRKRLVETVIDWGLFKLAIALNITCSYEFSVQ